MTYEVVWSGGPLLPDYPWASGLAVLQRSARKAKACAAPPTMLAPPRGAAVCACGCGERIVTKRRAKLVPTHPRFLRGHHRKLSARLGRRVVNPNTPWRGRFFKSGT